MSANETVTGNQVTIGYGIEANYGVAVDTDRTYGIQEKIGSIRSGESQRPLTEIGRQTYGKFAYGKLTRSHSVECILSSADIFQLPLGKVAKANSDKKITHTPSKQITSFTEIVSIADPVRVDRKFIGCVMRSLSMRASVGDLVSCSGDVMCGKEADLVTSGAVFAKVDDPVNFPYTYTHVSVQVAGVEIALVQSVELSISSNVELAYQMGTKDAVNGYKKLTEISGRMSLLFNDLEGLKYVTGRKEVASLVITIDNGVGSSIVITVPNVSFAEHSLSGIAPNELLKQDLNWTGRDIMVVETRV